MPRRRGRIIKLDAAPTEAVGRVGDGVMRDTIGLLAERVAAGETRSDRT